ncbi:transporter substrate-binding domain-containing protein [Motilimonas sp. E26]|uniref:substrate-binding periplasmic protein n=1 Tax=Motilimonas sp. E26 TaxID=2865674 RepID=UPI001E4AC48A|nr:transporter substrate-binding domain-containing protein [Motilimonas sp. E26]MCE0555522.1 transporter substrate-binding domain-containing protein [Motilimonas sp. E26]
MPLIIQVLSDPHLSKCYLYLRHMLFVKSGVMPLLRFGLLYLFLISSAASACDLTMGYRTTSRLPNIQAAPNNNGLYLDLYSEAAKRINCTLKVVRAPKNRIIRGIKMGNIDFYPGYTFEEQRTEYAYFIPNGLPAKPIGLSRIEMPEVHSYEDLQGKTLLVALGGVMADAKKYGISLRTPAELSFPKAIQFILDKNADFFKDEVGLAYYVKDHPRKNELRLHTDCCGPLTEFTLGFSKTSPYYKEIKNPAYNENEALSPHNFPVTLHPHSIAYQFQQALQQLQAEDFTGKLYKQYYGIHPSTLGMRLDNRK